MRFAELPSDLDDQLEAGLPPPPWFPVTGVITTSIPAQNLHWYSSQFNGVDPSAGVIRTSLDPRGLLQLGESEEVEVNPIDIVNELKENQEMPKGIPLIANRYTTIDPLSPMFRADRPKYGYGEFTPGDRNTLIKLLVAAAAVYYFLLRKK